MNWQPIDTAPRDGTEVLGWRRDCGVLIIRYTCPSSFLTEKELEPLTGGDADAVDWFGADFVQGCRLEGSEVPTHWMPLPDGPEALPA